MLETENLGEGRRKDAFKKFACEILQAKITFFGLILPFPVKMFRFAPDGHEGLLKNFKLENNLTIYQVYVL